MPLVDYSLRIIKDLIARVEQQPERTNTVLTLSYPDLIISRIMLADIFGPATVSVVPDREDSAATINWHKAHSITKSVLDTAALFKALGFEMESIDRTEGRGGEIIHDLSEPLVGWAQGDHYDIVFDCISNQCFNVAQVWANMVFCCRVGGYVLSVTPVTMVNQGFWCVNPAAYDDFARANDLEIVSREVVVGVYTKQGTIDIGPVRRHRNVPDDAMNVVVMQKKKHTHKPIWPIMSKFRVYPKCQIETPKGDR